MFRLFGRGWTNEAIEELFEAHPDGIGAAFKDGKEDLNAEIERLARAASSRAAISNAPTSSPNINAHHALVLAGNKTAIMKFEGATKFRLLQVDSFKQWFGNELVQVGDKMMGAGKYWLGHPKRRQYEGIEFEPAGGRRGYYNLWQGFTVQAAKGDCSKFLAHIRDNVAQGDEDTYNWIVGWWAQIFQQPALKMETALVLRGGFGAGKTKIGKVFGSLMDRALPAGLLAALHHRAIQLSHGLAPGAARRRSVLGRRQEERGHAEGSGDAATRTCSNTRASIRSPSRTSSACS